MPKRLFSTKPIGELHEADILNELQRTLDARALVLLGIGAIIGTGIFVLTGTAAANQAGPAITISYMAAGLACAFAALCYAEFAAMIPPRSLKRGMEDAQVSGPEDSPGRRGGARGGCN